MFVDEDGRLHLKIINQGGTWTCPELISAESFGYGAYNFILAENPALADNVTFGAFTWEDDTSSSNSREIDLELSRWNDPDSGFGQFVVQPWNNEGNLYRFDVPDAAYPYLYSFNWQDDYVGLHGTGVLPASGPPMRIYLSIGSMKGVMSRPAVMKMCD